MDSQQARKRRRERELVKNYLGYRQIEYSRRSIRSVREGRRANGFNICGPDVRVTCALNGQKTRVGIELTEYQVDPSNAGSHGRAFHNLLEKIDGQWRQLLRSEPGLEQYSGTLFFDFGAKHHPAPSDVAAELVRFLKSRNGEITNGPVHTYQRRRPERKAGGRIVLRNDFDGFPILGKLLTKLTVRDHGTHKGPYRWTWNCAAFIGVVPEVIIRLLNAKAKKVARYLRTRNDRLWLLICAPGDTPSACAGGEDAARRILASDSIRKAARNAGFDQVVCWDLAREWHIELCPG